jgi:hypothetical protein
MPLKVGNEATISLIAVPVFDHKLTLAKETHVAV